MPSTPCVPPGDRGAPVNRRRVVEYLALALVGLGRGDFHAGSHARRRESALRRATQRPAVTHLDAAALLSAIRAAPEDDAGHPGMYSLTLSAGTGHPVIGIRRTASTRSEVHATDGDVWYVLRGTANLVTGGTLVDGVETAPGELRGREIAGGESRLIRAGDLVVVPAGVPHWVSRVVTRELLYLVVKVPSKA
jgi:mannose-6-phosphate isomerase-like protein (cupin superfamily)